MIEPEFRDGLLPVIVQDAASRDVLMFAFMDREAFRLTRETGSAPEIELDLPHGIRLRIY